MSPIYEYECNRCYRQFEMKKGIHDPPADECPECGGSVHQIFYPVAIHYKSPGFFSTDHKPDTRVKSASGQLARRVSETDEGVINADSPQRTNSKGHPKATPTRSVRAR